MLSNCQDCQYFHPEACGVNPLYREKTQGLRTKLTPDELEFCTSHLPSCPDWERSRELEPLTHELTLTRAEWGQLAQALARQGLTDVLPEVLRPVVASVDNSEIVMVEVESSNIAAIGFRAGVCQVDFCNGRQYHYFDVPERVYLNFLDAPSKGRFLNQEIKGEFEYEEIW
jgi:hypothetical protein